jgi:hypothetical protein
MRTSSTRRLGRVGVVMIGADELATCDGVVERPDAAVPIAGIDLESTPDLPVDIPVHLIVGSDDDPFMATALKRRLTDAGYEDVSLTIVDGATHDDIYDASDSVPTLGLIRGPAQPGPRDPGRSPRHDCFHRGSKLDRPDLRVCLLRLA